MHHGSPHFTKLFPAKVILATLILCSVVAVALPFGTVSATSMCTLDCCAGRPPHAAGSCMSGACHAAITIRKRSHAHHAALQRSESICGLSVTTTAVAGRLSAKRMILNDPSLAKVPQKESPQRELAATSFGKPCLPDCGGCASGFANVNQQRNSTAFTYAQRPRLPFGIGPRYLAGHLVLARAGLCRRCIPRGPPTFFS